MASEQMDLEMHELELRYASLRVAVPARRARLLASISQHGQQNPVAVVAEGDHRFVLIDGYGRVDALRVLGRDIVAAVALPLSETEALVQHLLSPRQRCPFEDGSHLVELVERHGLSHRALALRLQRSGSWVCRRIGLVRALPDPVQSAVREGVVPAQAAMKYLVVLARANTSDCEQLVTNLGGKPVTVRQLEQLYLGWRTGDQRRRQNLVRDPWLYLRAVETTQQEPAHTVGPGDPASPLLQELATIANLAKRSRRRVNDGLLQELNDSRQQSVKRQAHQSHQALGELWAALCMEETNA